MRKIFFAVLLCVLCSASTNQEATLLNQNMNFWSVGFWQGVKACNEAYKTSGLATKKQVSEFLAERFNSDSIVARHKVEGLTKEN